MVETFEDKEKKRVRTFRSLMAKDKPIAPVSVKAEFDRTRNWFFQRPAAERKERMTAEREEAEAKAGFGIPEAETPEWGKRYGEMINRAQERIKAKGFGAKFLLAYAKTMADMARGYPECVSKFDESFWAEFDLLSETVREEATPQAIGQAKQKIRELREVLGIG